MTQFKNAFLKKISDSSYNNFGLNNYDEFRYGKITSFSKVKHIRSFLSNLFKKMISYRKNDWLQAGNDFYTSFIEHYPNTEIIYQTLNKRDRNLLVSLIAYSMLGRTKVMLPRNNEIYWESLKKVKDLRISNEQHDPKFMHFTLEKYDLTTIGIDIKLFFTEAGIATDFIIEQYSYKNNEINIEAQKGDTVLDLGGCWGDTALYFAEKVGENGKVFSFEFIPNNLKLHKINRELNPLLMDRIEVIEQPVSDVSGKIIYYKDNGPGSRIAYEPFDDQTGTTTTISIDDFVKKYNLKNVDFIKMDIEGAETSALEGAIETIHKFKPKLAIAIYHSTSDLINIPKWVLDLNLGYDIYIDHFTIHLEETMLFARVKV